MRLAGPPSNLEPSLESAVGRFDGASPVTSQVHHHFAFGESGSPARSRPRMRLVYAVALEEGADAGDVADVAGAVEILHQYALVHDDIEGNRLRHGRLAVWSEFGLAHGINAGDALCAIAYLQLLDTPERRAPERTVVMTRALQAANYAMCAGQAREIAFEGSPRIDPAAYLEMIEGKTSALFAVACELGALGAGAELERARAYGRLGRTYGLALQIEDDVLDLWGESPPEMLADDVARRKWAYPVVAALAGPPSPERDELAALYAVPGRPGETARPVVASLLDRLGARDAALAVAGAYAAEADAAAAAHGVDRSGAVRAFFNREIRRVA